MSHGGSSEAPAGSTSVSPVRRVAHHLASGALALPAAVATLALAAVGLTRAALTLRRSLWQPLEGSRSARPRHMLVRAALTVPVALVSSLAVATIGFVIARSLYYPFGAFRAAQEDLAASWGGPTPLGATAAHWLIGTLIVVLSYLVLRGAESVQIRLWTERGPARDEMHEACWRSPR